jgi:hypothetical protein
LILCRDPDACMGMITLGRNRAVVGSRVIEFDTSAKIQQFKSSDAAMKWGMQIFSPSCFDDDEVLCSSLEADNRCLTQKLKSTCRRSCKVCSENASTFLIQQHSLSTPPQLYLGGVWYDIDGFKNITVNNVDYISKIYLKEPYMVGSDLVSPMIINRTSECAPGYSGSMLCDRCEKRYGKNGSLCEPCPKDFLLSWIYLFAGSFGSGLYSIYMVRCYANSLNDCKFYLL